MKTISVVFIFIIVTSTAFADTIILKSGKSLTATIIEQSDHHIRVDVGTGIPITYYADDIQSVVIAPVSKPAPQIIRNTVKPKIISIPLNPLRNLNGLRREDIFNIRRQQVNKISALASQNYQPSLDVYGQIQDGKPWWGLLGLSYFGPGERSIEGLSRESQFVENPYLLIGICEKYAQIVMNPSLAPKEIYPKPTKLTWSNDRRRGEVVYNVSQSYQLAVGYKHVDPQEHHLVVINARDFGFNFFVIDANRSRNINASANKVLPIIQYIHAGGSCGYPGGCNNRSPTQKDLLLKWTTLPARVYVKLWKIQP